MFRLVAANDAYYLTEDDSRAHEVLMCIGEGKTVNDGTRTIFGSSKFYVRSAEEMWQLFGKECPKSLTNTLEIARKCQFELPLGDNLSLPEFPIPKDSNCSTTDEYFRKVVLEGFKFRQETVWNEQQKTRVFKVFLLKITRNGSRQKLKRSRIWVFPDIF